MVQYMMKIKKRNNRKDWQILKLIFRNRAETISKLRTVWDRGRRGNGGSDHALHEDQFLGSSPVEMVTWHSRYVALASENQVSSSWGSGQY